MAVTVVTTGFFDGVHLGHRLIIESTVSAAREQGGESIVLTFWPHPRNVLQDEARHLRLLNSLEEKRAILAESGADRVEVLPFTRAFSRMTAREYLQEVVRDRFHGDVLVVGYDNRMGSDRLGASSLRPVAERLGMRMIRTEEVQIAGVTVSSTKIRRAVAEGEVGAAAAMLGRRYSLYGVVVTGNRIGRTLGFPTANMQLYEPLKLIPGNGVYAVEVETLGGRYGGMCNIGFRPTVTSGRTLTVETHIFDFHEDIYGLDIRVTFVGRVREERQFPSVEELKRQLALDRTVCRGMLRDSCPEIFILQK